MAKNNYVLHLGMFLQQERREAAETGGTATLVSRSSLHVILECCGGSARGRKQAAWPLWRALHIGGEGHCWETLGALKLSGAELAFWEEMNEVSLTLEAAVILSSAWFWIMKPSRGVRIVLIKCRDFPFPGSIWYLELLSGPHPETLRGLMERDSLLVTHIA